jgi:monofunctional biosynthetic peptidoglycan transglycosylase
LQAEVFVKTVFLLSMRFKLFNGGGLKKAWWWAKNLFVLAVQITLFFTILYRVAPIPVTPLMVLRLDGIDKDWVPYEKINKNVIVAAMTSEDPNFNTHFGFELEAIKDAIEDMDEEGKPMRGGSTISQQTAKNVFLFPGEGFTRYIRKAIEIPLTGLIEAMWTKRRIMEVYLNIIEMGPGIYGIEATAQRYYKKPASKLSAGEAASIVVCFPLPLKRQPTALKPRLQRKRDRVTRWMAGYKLPDNLDQD